MMAALRMYEHDILRQERREKTSTGLAYICASAAHLRAPDNEGGAACRPPGVPMPRIAEDGSGPLDLGLEPPRKRLNDGKDAKSGKDDTWMKTRITVLKLIASMRQDADAPKDEL